MNFRQGRINMGHLRLHHNIRGMETHKLFAGIAKHLAGGGIGIEVVALGIGQHHTHLGMVKQSAIAGFANLQLLREIDLGRRVGLHHRNERPCR